MLATLALNLQLANQLANCLHWHADMSKLTSSVFQQGPMLFAECEPLCSASPPHIGGAGDFGAQLASGKSTLANAATGTVSSRSGKGKDDGSLDLAKFPVPKCLDGRLATWTTDEEFGMQFLAGLNPLVLEVLGPARLEKLLVDSPGINAAQDAIAGEWGDTQ